MPSVTARLRAFLFFGGSKRIQLAEDLLERLYDLPSSAEVYGRAAADGVTLRRTADGARLQAVGDVVRLRVRGRDEARDRWELELLPDG